ncbi:bifunctional (p)ppGpp synthetase/guanosine-3',5'-bis(diphosphate) 3'-pyrophosphohydrolase [Streptomyces armeniacus]|uniref:Bifunctional (P)ppGpp synthetase/guanosine-3',5'-bis(Diphosphate) 3'-pyrophosphohydrolase n=1 Tax=Streptomyces armeniacus TaxID=83291 RepID=A0A345XP05_9ACTN|nr:bifunctional (p)ppGpp synthetase/guanosine-3',5'-bis(diphosphate) 3'-pyrophosphohydrolase [Streptomyces armeniacus]
MVSDPEPARTPPSPSRHASEVYKRRRPSGPAAPSCPPSTTPPTPAPASSSASSAAASSAASSAESVSVVTPHPDAPVRLARCCTPVPPDAVTGFPVRGGAVTVHRDSCQTVVRMAAAGRSSVSVRWRKLQAGCRVTLLAEAFGRPQLLADLTETIASEGAAVVSADVEPPCEQRVRHTYTLHLPDATGLPALMRAMRRVPGVYDVSRAVRRVPAG